MENKNKVEKITYIALWCFLVIVVIGISVLRNNNFAKPTTTTPEPTSNTVTSENSNIEKPQNSATNNDSMVGVWISYISFENISIDDFKQNFDKLVEDAKKVYATDLFVHVRAFADAMYPSNYFPWSHLLTGEQGGNPNFDPLEYMVEKTHNEGMKFHAWINPLRVSLKTMPKDFADNNPYNVYSSANPYYFIECDGKITINPAYKEMRTLIANGVAEIVENYNVDGIHFDDYFYPEDITAQDQDSYNAYCETVLYPLSIEDWRKTNVNTLIAQVYREIKNINSNVVFGISPQANLDNNKEIGADVLQWCSTTGYIDYICPQIYFSFDSPYLGFNESLNQWLEIPKYDGLDLYIGLAFYKAGTDSDADTWNEDDVLAREYKQSLASGANGVVFYDVRSITDEIAQKELENLQKVILK